jgi:O-antigen ligase
MTLLLDRAIFFALLALIALLAVPYGAVEPWWESIFECAVFTLAALWIVEGLLGGSWRLSNSGKARAAEVGQDGILSHKKRRVLFATNFGGCSLLAPLAALAIFAFLQSWTWRVANAAAGIESQVWTAVSADPYETRRFAFKLLALVLAGALLQSHITSRRRLAALINVLIFVGVASALFGIVRQTAQHDEGFLLAYLRPSEGYAQFINRNHFAFLMEMMLGLALGLVVGGGARSDRMLIYVAAMIPLWAGLALSNSRGGVCALLSQALFLALLFGYVRRYSETPEAGGLPSLLTRIGRSPLARISLVACLVTVLAFGVIWMGGDPLVSRLENLPEDVRAAAPDERASESRIEIWRATWRLIEAHPVAGSGFGAYGVAIPAHHDSSGEMTPREAHNDYLELLASGGVIGGLIGLWFVIVLIRNARRQLLSRDPFRRAACFGAVVGLFGVAIHSLIDFGLHITINALVFISLAVIATLDGKALASGTKNRSFG